MTWAVVVPTNRPERFAIFEKAWEPLFQTHDVAVFPVRDEPPWKDIPEWIPRRSDMIRSWGFVRAWNHGATYTLSLDDDVLPIPGVDIFAEYERVFNQGAPVSPYLDVGALTSYGLPLRGFPYKDRRRTEVSVQYGGWIGVLDYDACSQLAFPQGPHDFAPIDIPVPKGAAVTGCAMNMAFRTEYTPIVWQLPLLEGRYDRYGDIWAGLFAKRVLDRLGKAVVVNGRARVLHHRASDPVANLAREAPGVPVNETLWEHLYCPTGDTLAGCYQAVTDSARWQFRRVDPEYAAHFKECRDEWLGCFQ